ncbi:hydroxyethylthiazole kinase [Vagococcus sp.]|uniref:hydroxyethylthiazole kinase n=1 Tax=Vagococcus sp. TaxID=1933889 RepID=UPI003F9CDF13
MNTEQRLKAEMTTIFPLKRSPLVHCMTNEITCESMANALLYIDAKPVMAADQREFDDFFKQTDGLLLNIGHLSTSREASLRHASQLAQKLKKPTVVDIVGITATELRYHLSHQLLENNPEVVKGNFSEMRALCGLETKGRGVDGAEEDQEPNALIELATSLVELQKQYPKTTFLATGATDVVVSLEGTFLLNNGVKELDCFTGTGDIVGAMIAALLGLQVPVLQAIVTAVSYFNCCGEQAKYQLKTGEGLASFRHQTLDQLSVLMKQKNWAEGVTLKKL